MGGNRANGHAHPEPGSFCAAQMCGAADTLREQGYMVEISDLYAMNWGAALDRADFMHPLEGQFKPQAEQVRAAKEGSFAPDVAAELEKLQAADLLVFSSLLWWFSLAALLKGWVDRVFTMGTVYGGGVGTYDTGLFRGRRALLTTGGVVEHYGPNARDGEMNVNLFHIQNGMLRFTVLAPVISYSLVRLTREDRAAQLGRVRGAFETLDEREVASG
ncbi:NAD(P)H-dependent oxidoreductase [Deinococcus arenicola]|uniref:NAD(P)H-dependent oxidoreductase n=1 Tax=Deinococcus arenicola TaxID=2994950 RepID=A0ABU4DSW7_9DEIO|nr:NAD(P)H-dependent oxidoreductase [Deinococcus sp. ZS9-10]MDV6375520.1 NAD(P)H-dependent oxidoreductase [Deinococcus sp. ZS9-10]